MSYIENVRPFAERLKGDAEFREKIVALLNKKGHEYFGQHKYPYRDIEELEDRFEVLNMTEFTKRYLEDTGTDEIWENEAAFDDSYRHAIFVNISDLENPKLVDAPAELMSAATDWILTWDKVQEIPKFFPDNKTIAIHLDTIGPEIFFPIPTVTPVG